MRKIPDPRRLISGLFPILRWSRSYDIGHAVGDLIAGITIALTLIPQSMAYASLAGFEPQVRYLSCTVDKIYAHLPLTSNVLHERSCSTPEVLSILDFSTVLSVK